MIYTRRDIGRLALAALAAPNSPPHSKIKGVQIGAITYSFRQGVPKAEIMPDMAKIGLSEVELMSGDAEVLAGAPLTPAQIAAREARQKAIKDWRAAATPATWEGVRKQCSDAGIALTILCYNMNVNMADEEIEYAFAMAKAMKVKAISCSATVTFARRVAPFADKHKIVWAGHGHDNTSDPEQFAKPETFEFIMSLSKYIGVNLDIGHFTAAGYDPIPFIQKHHARITNLHLKDRKREHGPNVPWGTGDTPIKEVLLLLSKEKYSIPANIELEYPIPAGSDPVAEVGKCYRYARKCLEG